MTSDQIITILLSVVSSGAVFGFIQFLITRHDAKNDNTTQIINRLDGLEQKIDENQAILARTHILRFADELKNGITHSDEYFRQQIDDCDTYEHYCNKHPDFKNSYTELSSQFIKDTFKQQLGGNKNETI